MKIIVLTPIYETSTLSQGATPVVHYFTREWVKNGHDVTVFHFAAKYPKPFYWIAKFFHHELYSHFGFPVPVFSPVNDDYRAEGVTVHRRCLLKLKPHALYSPSILRYALDCVIKECELNGVPDWFIGHWDNPQLELLTRLKRLYNKPIGLVLHSNDFHFENKFGNVGIRMIEELDVIGFRSEVARINYIKKYGEPKHYFIAYSGVSDDFLSAGRQFQKVVNTPVHRFVFVGSLIERKYPALVLSALSAAYPDGDFIMTYIGDGAERQKIEDEYKRLGRLGVLRFTGRIPREEIVEYLKDADVFVMVSEGEIFGLVYLEAMALGLIPIGSRGEGIDGIINDGENGFLCGAGKEDELISVLKRLRAMTSNQLKQMSINAKQTAFEYSDECVANNYIKALLDSQN